MHKYKLISKKGEGTFSEVLKAQSIKSGKQFAIKCMKNHFDSIDQVNNLREIQALKRIAGHPNIIKLHEVLYDEPTGRLALVFELMDMNLYEAIKGLRHYLPDQKVKAYMYEMLKALDHMHRNGIFHRDVKPENLLLMDDEIKLADLGSCRGIYSRQPFTEYISTRWYRAPECLLTDGFYNFKMDLFAAGCVAFEIVALFPLFPGQNEMDQIAKIHGVLGTPSPELLASRFKRNASHMDFNFPEKKGTEIERLIPHAEPDLVELMRKLIKYDPDERIIARKALKDPYFRELRDAERAKAEPSQAGTERVEHSASHCDAPEQAHEGGAGWATSPTSTGVATGLPNIKSERRRAGGGAGASGAGGDSEGDHEDNHVLPPIGTDKGKAPGAAKAAGKTATLKTAGNTALQKSGTISQHPLGVLGTSKGFTGTQSSSQETSSSIYSTDAMSSTSPYSWGGAKDRSNQSHKASGSRGAPMAGKMGSTWAAPNCPPGKPSGSGSKRH